VRVAELAADEWGVLSVTELHRCGLNDQAIHIRVANGRLHPIHRGVYAVGHPAITLQGRFLAAVKACGEDAALSRYAAAANDGFIKWEERLIDVTVRGTSHRAHDGIRVHRTNSVDPRDFRRHNGIPTTSPARTLLDLAATPRINPHFLRRAVRQAQATNKVNIRELAEIITRCQGQPGTRRLANLVATGPAPTRSELEDVVLDLILSGGFEHPDVNKRTVVNGRILYPDFRWPEQRLIVEADSTEWHSGHLANQDDAERQALLESFGERVLRVTWAQAITKPAQTRTRLRQAGAPGR
jgi:very-short-patch-repair endonuclease